MTSDDVISGGGVILLHQIVYHPEIAWPVSIPLLKFDHSYQYQIYQTQGVIDLLVVSPQP